MVCSFLLALQKKGINSFELITEESACMERYKEATTSNMPQNLPSKGACRFIGLEYAPKFYLTCLLCPM